jgi:Fe-S-cluster containining protein
VSDDADDAALDFFNAQRANFARTCATLSSAHPGLADALALQAGDNYQKNAEIQAEGQPPPACARGCDACCGLQVSATAPEIFHVAHFVRLTARAFARHGVDLGRDIGQAQAQIAGLNRQQRFAAQKPCPFVIGGACSIYSVRPLACRGHISFDRDACEAVARGCDVEVPISAAHKTTRMLVQGALQAALRDAGLAWGAYDFLGALDRALKNPECEAQWRLGADVFADFRLDADNADAAPLREAAHAM